MAHVVKTDLDFPTVQLKGPDGLFTVTQMAAVPVDHLFAQLAQAAVAERRRRQILYPRVTPEMAQKTVDRG